MHPNPGARIDALLGQHGELFKRRARGPGMSSNRQSRFQMRPTGSAYQLLIDV